MRRSSKPTAKYRERAAECANLASTAIIPHMRDEYREIAQQYLALAEAENQKKLSSTPIRRRKTGRSFKFGRNLAPAT
jgi:hypothetical protein